MILILIFSSLILRVNSSSAGAPAVACRSMTPQHNANESTLALLFETTFSETQVFSNTTVIVTIKAKDGSSNFKGFLLMALDDSTRQAVGQFRIPTDGSSQLLSCYDIENSAVTHSNNLFKNHLEFEWIPPQGFEGTVKFWTTYVKNYAEFWVKRSSETLQIIASEPVPTTLPPASTPVAQIPNVSIGCGSTKGCLVLPNKGCVNNNTCTSLISHRKVNDSTIEFEIYSNLSLNHYIAMGFSKDKNMGDDSVVECVFYNDKVQAFQSFNTPKKSNTRKSPGITGFQVISSSYVDGYVYCKVHHPVAYQLNNVSFDLSQAHNILMALGNAADGFSITQHENVFLSDATVVVTSDTKVVQMGQNRALKQAHGALMVIAWLIAGSIGLLMPRYMKKTWVGQQFYKKDLWFVYHRALMLLTWILTIIAFIIIFVDVGGWVTETISENPHPLIGCITTGLAFIQPIMAYFRPAPNASNRYIFNWAHSIVGYSAHTLAITCIFLAVEMDEAELPFYTYWVLTAHICCYVGAQIAFTLLARRNASVMAELKNIQDRDEPGSSVRRNLLYAYMIVMLALGFTVVGFIGSS